MVLYVLDTSSDTKAGEAGVPAGEAGEAKAVGEGEATAGVGANGTAWPTAVEQYEALRRELYLYNPDYLARLGLGFGLGLGLSLGLGLEVGLSQHLPHAAL